MMNSCPVPLKESREQGAILAPCSPVKCLPALWSQMAPCSRQQLVQQIAELVQRIRLPHQEMEVKVNEPS
jgi:hypothetical protein